MFRVLLAPNGALRCVIVYICVERVAAGRLWPAVLFEKNSRAGN
jgi:hypothetical protein